MFKKSKKQNSADEFLTKLKSLFACLIVPALRTVLHMKQDPLLHLCVPIIPQ